MGAAETANRLSREGQVPPFILITPANYAGKAHGAALKADLIPYIGEHFRTRANAHGLQTNVLYFALPGEMFAGLVRQVTVRNVGDAPVALD